jgi:Flp pilus assembly pilin Flp
MSISFDAVDAVDKSWNIIRQIPNYEQVAGEILFRKVFELAPGALGMYQFGSDFANGSEEDLYKHPIFINHAKGVVTMLDVAISLLGPDLDPVTVALKDLGARHVEYGVLPAHYEVVGQALLYTLETALGEHWTAPVQTGWVGVYHFVSSAMMDGAENYLSQKLADEKEQERRTAEKAASAKKAAKKKVKEAAEQQRQKAAAAAAADPSKWSPTSASSSTKSVTMSAEQRKRLMIKQSRLSLDAIWKKHKSSSVATSSSPKTKKNRGIVHWIDKAMKMTTRQ